MKRAIMSELIKMRRVSSLYVAAAGVFVALLAVLLVLFNAGGEQQGPLSPPSSTDLAGDGGFALLFAQSSTLIGVVALGFAASAVASEYSDKTLRVLLATFGRRTPLLAGKLIAIGLLLAAAVLAAYVVTFVVALAAAPAAGISTSAWWSMRTLTALPDSLIAALAWGVLGAVLGIVLRSPTPALGVGVSYALPLETILTTTVSSATQWLPGQLFRAIASRGTEDVSYERALMLAAVYVAAGLAFAFGLFRWRDVSE